MKTIIKNLKEYNSNLISTPRGSEINTLENDVLIDISISLSNTRRGEI